VSKEVIVALLINKRFNSLQIIFRHLGDGIVSMDEKTGMVAVPGIYLSL
jgi:hypothetical protein